jgi:hypothetical protein
MKISSLFNLISDASNIIEFFEGVESPEQLVSRLERLKRMGTKELLECIDDLRNAVLEVLDDTLEMSASISEGEDSDSEEDDLLSDEELDSLVGEEKPSPEPEKQNPASSDLPEGEKIIPS